MFPSSWLWLLFPDNWELGADCFFQIRHLDRGQSGLESLVAHLQSGAINRLLQRLASQHPKRMRHSSLLRRLPNAPSDFIHNDIVVRGVPTQQTANAEDRVVLFGLSQHPGHGRNLERTRRANQRNILFPGTRAQHSIVSALKKSLRNEGIEAGNNNRKPKSIRVKATVNRRNCWLGERVEFYFLFRTIFQFSLWHGCGHAASFCPILERTWLQKCLLDRQNTSGVSRCGASVQIGR